jgi:hypothetical protein
MTPTHITITHLGAEICVTGSCHLVRFQPDPGGTRSDTQGRHFLDLRPNFYENSVS